MATAPGASSEMRDALLACTIEAVSLEGIEGITLRSIAAAAGCSTALVFQHFAGKSQLIDAALEHALEQDRDFHEEFANRIDGLRLGLGGLATLISAYVELRATQPIAQVWSEVLFKSGQIESSNDLLGRWTRMRSDFWSGHLALQGLDRKLGHMLHTYVLMEEVYSYALHDRVEYLLMLRETTRALVERFLGSPPKPCESAVSQWASADHSRFSVDDSMRDADSLRERLITFGIAEIIAHGIAGMSLRKIAKRANASLSMIAYHFGDTESFVNETVWRALIEDLPHEVDPNRRGGTPLSTMSDWTGLLANLIRPHEGETPPGFYVGVSRLIGQAALFARRQKNLLPIILHLRKIEGSGTFRASQTIWPQGFTIERSAATVFGIWVKGQALLNETIASEAPARTEEILEVAAYLYETPA